MTTALQDFPSKPLTATAEAVSRRWRDIALASAGFAALLGIVYADVLGHLVRQWWTDDNYSHGFVVPVFSGYLVWQRRAALAAAPIRGTWAGWPVLLLGIVALVVGDIAAENFLMRSSLIIVIVGLIQIHLGSAVLNLLAFPLAFLAFMVPLPATVFYAVAFPLQKFAAMNSAWLLDGLGVPVLLDGNVIHLSRLSLGVVEACSGIRSLISLLALAVAWAYVTLPGVGAMGILVSSAVPITVIANTGRIVATALVGQTLGPEYARGFFHTFSGWMIFVVALVCLVIVHHLVQIGSAWSRSRPWPRRRAS